MPRTEADSPLMPSAAHRQRIRLRAYHLWEREGRPDGQSTAYWERAEELDAIAQNPPTEIPLPNPQQAPLTAEGVVIDEASLQENLGAFPARFTDQGETMATPESREIAREFRDGER